MEAITDAGFGLGFDVEFYFCMVSASSFYCKAHFTKNLSISFHLHP